MIFILYLILIGIYFATYNLAPLLQLKFGDFTFRGNDIFFIPILIFTIYNMVFNRNSNLHKYKTHPYYKYFLIYLFLILFMVFNGYLFLGSSRSSLFLQIRNYVPFFLSFFSTLLIVKNMKQIKILVTVVLLFSIVSAIITYLQANYGSTPLFNDDTNTGFYVTTAWTGQNSMKSIGNLQRVSLPSIAMITAISFYIFLGFFNIRYIHNYAIFLLFIGALIINYSRAHILGFIVALLLILLMNIKKTSYKLKIYLYMMIFAVITFLIITYLEQITDLDITSSVTERLLGTSEEFERGGGTWAARLIELGLTMNYWKKDLHYILFGMGIEPARLLQGLTDTGTFLHIGFFDLPVRAGILGMLIFFYLQFKFLTITLKKINHHKDENLRRLYLTFLGYHITILITFIATNYFFNPYFGAVFGVFGALPVIYENINKKMIK